MSRSMSGIPWLLLCLSMFLIKKQTSLDCFSSIRATSFLHHLNYRLLHVLAPPPLNLDPGPLSKSNSKHACLNILLFLAGDVSLNPGPQCSFGFTNLRSIKNKSPAVCDLISTCSFDIFCMSETWLSTGDSPAFISSITPPNFQFFHVPRPNKRGGGVGIFVNQTLHSTVPMDTTGFSSFESIVVRVRLGNVTVNFVSMYRPPQSHLPVFFDEFSTFIEIISSWTSPTVITGDLNIHVDSSSSSSLQLTNLLQSHDLSQHVNFATHLHGHTIDLLITTPDCPSISKVWSADILSDHYCIGAKLDHSIPSPELKSDPITYRKFAKIDMSSLRHDLSTAFSSQNGENTPDLLYDFYHSTLTKILDIHAPACTFVPKHPVKSWITPAILQAKRVKRQLERLWRKYKSPLFKSKLRRQINLYNRLITSAKHQYFKQVVDASQGNSKKLWDTLRTILHKSQSTSLPDSSSYQDLANAFADFFSEKIQKIHNTFSDNSHPTDISPPYTPPEFNNFSSVSTDELKKTILSSPTKSCCLDPWPTFLVKDFLDSLTLPITNIINSSLSQGIFPQAFKRAIVTPLLKKPKLDRNEFKNYRPVSNLNFISKVLERVVSIQLSTHINAHNLGCPVQSAYQPFHSTETALLKIKNDIMINLAKGQATALVLLDLSAAFDTIDHALLLHRLSHWFGIKGSALDWFASYLSGRNQSVKAASSFSSDKPLCYGVPQGSVLGPFLFSLYTTPLTYLISSFSGLQHHFYADDTQLYITLTRDTATAAFQVLSNCLTGIQTWMDQNKLKLNPDKTEFILFGNPKLRSDLTPLLPSTILGAKISCCESVRNLGVLFDSNLTFHSHISNVTKSCFFHIRDLSRLRRCLSLSTAIALANALVSSRLDYCNALLHNITKSELLRLQRIQNALCRVLTRTSRFSHISPHLKALHWLPVKQRVVFKTCLLIFKSLNYGKPSYLASYLKPYQSPKSTRMSDPSLNFLNCPSYPSKIYIHPTYLDCAFQYSAPRLWNSLPHSIRTASSLGIFRKKLKAHLFSEAFPT